MAISQRPASQCHYPPSLLKFGFPCGTDQNVKHYPYCPLQSVCRCTQCAAVMPTAGQWLSSWRGGSASAAPTYHQTPHDNCKRLLPHQEGFGGATIKDRWRTTIWECISKELGNFSKYFTIFLTSVESSTNPTNPNLTYLTRSAKVLMWCPIDRQLATPQRTVCTNTHLGARTRALPRLSTAPGLDVCEWSPEGLYDKSVSLIPNTDEILKFVKKKMN